MIKIIRFFFRNTVFLMLDRLFYLSSKNKIAPLHAMEACRRSRGTVPPILDLGPRAGLDFLEKRKIPCRCWDSNLGSLSSWPRNYEDYAMLAATFLSTVGIPQYVS